MRPNLNEAAARLGRARHVVALTGAGISAESGVPTFRGEKGLWRNFRPEQLATPDAFERDPQLVWDWYQWRQGIVRGCEPNPGHTALVDLARKLRLTLVTQNIDGLHERAGSDDVIEMHGNIWKTRCTREGGVRDFVAGQLKCECGAWLRPHIVWFGEPLEAGMVQRTFEAAKTCDVLLCVGSSSQVQPANMLPLLAKSNGAVVIEINLEPTALTVSADFFLKGPAGELLPRLLGQAFPMKEQQP